MAQKSPIRHHYLLFEFDNTGYVLRYFKCSEQNIKVRKKVDKIYYWIASKEEKGYSSQEIADEIGFISSYSIKTHKERMRGHTEAPSCLRFSSASDYNVLYHLCSPCELKDFTKLIRFDQSHTTLYLNSIINPEGFEDCMEIYLN